jgi:hypothetical protein
MRCHVYGCQRGDIIRHPDPIRNGMLVYCDACFKQTLQIGTLALQKKRDGVCIILSRKLYYYFSVLLWTRFSASRPLTACTKYLNGGTTDADIPLCACINAYFLGCERLGTMEDVKL